MVFYLFSKIQLDLLESTFSLPRIQQD